MGTIIKIFMESVAQALSQLRGNKLRSFLSLLGISIGIFCIIGVFSAVDSLEDNVRGSLAKLGDDVLYVQKISWSEDPGSNWFKYLRRPNVDYQDYEAVKKRVKTADLVGYWIGIGRKVAKFRGNSVEGAYLLAMSYEGEELFSLNFAQGRYFSPTEYNFGANKVVLGAVVAEELFGPVDPIGRTIKAGGRNLEVIGVLEKAGESIVNVMNFDEVMLISYELARKIANLKQNSFFGDSSVGVKAKAGIPLAVLKDEVTSAMRAHRRLKPRQEDDFSLNQLSIISNFLNGFFNALNILGVFIGGFATLVGMFSVANIMFVSVKERTRIIGVKKALGAKQYMILLEFLVESVILCILGGLAGLGLVYIVLFVLTQTMDSFQLYLSWSNVILGISLSAIIGILAGMIPATQAARMDPVVAMRQ
ncbi:MAG: ABC transporter permease [Lewinellaceae bacterium]|nr:ABC transporter permease [Lewinellaceae bacterium]